MNARSKTLRVLLLIALTACLTPDIQAQGGMWIPDWRLRLIAVDLVTLDKVKAENKELQSLISGLNLEIKDWKALDKKNVELLSEKDFQIMILNEKESGYQKEIDLWKAEVKKHKRQRRLFVGAVVVGTVSVILLKR